MRSIVSRAFELRNSGAKRQNVSGSARCVRWRCASGSVVRDREASGKPCASDRYAARRAHAHAFAAAVQTRAQRRRRRTGRRRLRTAENAGKRRKTPDTRRPAPASWKTPTPDTVHNRQVTIFERTPRVSPSRRPRNCQPLEIQIRPLVRARLFSYVLRSCLNISTKKILSFLHFSNVVIRS